MNIRLAVSSDNAAINAIYNHYVAHSTCTYQTQPTSEDERHAWLAQHGERHPVLVAEATGTVVGWGSLSPFHQREAYRFTVEDSVYVHPEHLRRGVGRVLLAKLIALGTALKYRSMIGIISADQAPSIALHAQAGFRQVGRLAHVGYKFDTWLDVIYVQRELAH